MTIVDASVLDAHFSASAAVARAKRIEEALVAYPIPLDQFLGVDGAELGVAEDVSSLYRKVSGNIVTLLGRTPDNTTEAAAAVVQVTLPPEYVADGDVRVAVVAQFVDGAGADTGRASTIDVEVYEQAAGAVGGDLNGTGAIAFSADDTYETKTFIITDTDLAPGDLLNILVTASAKDDAGGGASTQIEIGEVYLLLDIQG